MAKDINFSGDDIDDKDEAKSLAEEVSKAPKEDPVINVDDIDEDAPAQEKSNKSRDRYWMNKKQREELEAGIRRRDEELAVIRQQQSLLIQQQQQFFQQNQRQAEPQKDPVDEEIDFLIQKAQFIRSKHDVEAAQGRMTPQIRADMERQLNETEIAIVKKTAEKTVRQHIPQQGNPQQAALVAHVNMTYPDVAGDPAKVRWAKGWEEQQLAMGRSPTLEDIMENTRKAFRSGQYSPTAPRKPAPYMADRLAGAPRGTSGGTEPGNGRQVVMTREMKKMANARFPNIKDERKRYEAFAKMVADEDRE